MADQGFVVNDAEQASIGTSYSAGQAILLHEDLTADPLSRAMPQACYLSHLELQLDVTSGSPATVSCFLTWDSSGDDPLSAEAQLINLHAGMTDTSLRNTAVATDVYVRAPTGQTTANKCYLFLKVNDGAVTLKKARLLWAVR
tara:strand:- start:2900 stop:3328 length:429 start_codon:yes stop_codon:yes gene_type:complete